MAELLPCAGEVWFGVREKVLSVGSTLVCEFCVASVSSVLEVLC